MNNRPVILFVDDEVTVLSSVERLLRDEEYETWTTTSAAEALALIETHPVRVVVSDLMMPGMNGLQLLEQLRTSHPHIVRICLSGQTQVPLILSAIARGSIFRFLTKPWRVDGEAKAILREALEYADFLAQRSPS